MKKDTIKKYYDTVAVKYNYDFYQKKDSYPPLKYRHNYILKMIEQEKLPEPCTILDIGCGPGEMVCDLVKDNREILGLDISEEMIAIAKQKLEKKVTNIQNVYLAVGDIENLTFYDKTFDVIICAGVVEYLENDDKWVVELSRVLKPGGILIVNITNKYAIRRWSLFLFENLKTIPFLLHGMNFLKERILYKGKVVQFPFKPRTHSPKKFDNFLKTHGFNKISHNYFSFCIMPYPFDTLLSFISVPVRRYLEKFSEYNMIVWGTGYIVKVRKNP